VKYVAGLMSLVRGTMGRGWAAVRSDLSDLETALDVLTATPTYRSSGLGSALDASTPTYLSVVPTQLVGAFERPRLVAALARCSAVLVGGARLEPTVRAAAEERRVRVVQTYGMSETCGGVVYDGVPLDGVVVGFEGGRITLTTPTCFAGYWGDPQATADVLDGRTFRTSDRGHIEGGRLTVTGRCDAVVQSGGVNVDLDELQRLLDAEWGTGELIVFAAPDSVWGSRIMAATTRLVSVDEIHRRLGDRVTGAARPRGVLTVGAFPLTASGKPDRRQLAELSARNEEGDHGDDA
jgi:O-succinylbenzoic acid--CoA ligase